jgi:hypothetical protein
VGNLKQPPRSAIASAAWYWQIVRQSSHAIGDPEKNNHECLYSALELVARSQ